MSMSSRFNNRKVNSLSIIIALSILASLINILPVILSYITTPQGLTNLLTGHYFADYFTYLQALAQGVRGVWIVENPYSAGEVSYLYGWWPYLVLGRFASIFSLSPQVAYWLSVFVLSVSFVCGAFYVIQKMLPREKYVVYISALIIFLFSTPLIKFQELFTKYTIGYYDYWYAPNILFRRLGNIPYHLLSSLFTLILLCGISYLIDRLGKKPLRQIIITSLITASVLALLMTFAPFNTVLIVIAGVATFFVAMMSHASQERRAIFTQGIVMFGIIGGIIGPVGLTLKMFIAGAGPVFRASLWEQSLAPFYPNPLEFIQIMGAIMVVAPFGIIYFQKNRSTLATAGIMFVFAGIAFFYSPLASLIGTHHWRFLNPVMYVFLSAFFVSGIRLIFRDVRAVIIAALLIFALGAPINITFLKNQLADPNLATKISSVPDDIIEAFIYLDSRVEPGVVLTGPQEYMGLLVPIFTRHHVFLARELSTSDFTGRTKDADDFFTGRLSKGAVQSFLVKNQIRYILLTSIDPYSPKLLESYSFLKMKFHSNNGVIFEYIN